MTPVFHEAVTFTEQAVTETTTGLSLTSATDYPYTLGTSGADTITGSSVADTILAGRGNDRVTANNGNDVISGGIGIRHAEWWSKQ
jgi:Ca2+-binding RTX toxin-like protein